MIDIVEDNIDFLKSIPDESVDLVYTDPPFFTQKKAGTKRHEL